MIKEFQIELPASIRDDETNSLNATHATIIDRLPLWSLKIDFSGEVDRNKLLFWLESFGVPQSLIDTYVTAKDVKRLIQAFQTIKQYAGTRKSVRTIAEALLATNVSVTVVDDYVLRYNGLTVGTFGEDNSGTQSQYNGSYLYDAAASCNKYLVDILMDFEGNLSAFKSRFKSVFKDTQPMRIAVRKIEVR